MTPFGWVLATSIILLSGGAAAPDPNNVPDPNSGGPPDDPNAPLDVGDLTVPTARLPVALRLKDTFLDYGCDTSGWGAVTKSDPNQSWSDYFSGLSAGGKVVTCSGVNPPLTFDRSDTLIRGDPNDVSACTIRAVGDPGNIKFAQGEVGASSAAVQFWKNASDYLSNSTSYTAASAGDTTIVVADPNGYAAGDDIQISGTTPATASAANGTYSWDTYITEIDGSTFTLATPIPTDISGGTVQLADKTRCTGLEYLTVEMAQWWTVQGSYVAYSAYVTNASRTWINEVNFLTPVGRVVNYTDEAAEGTLFMSNINNTMVHDPNHCCQGSCSGSCGYFFGTNQSAVELVGASNIQIVSNRMVPSQTIENTGWSGNILAFANYYPGIPAEIGNYAIRPHLLVHGFGALFSYLSMFEDFQQDDWRLDTVLCEGQGAWERIVTYGSRSLNESGGAQTHTTEDNDNDCPSTPLSTQITNLVTSGDGFDGDLGSDDYDNLINGAVPVWMEYVWNRGSAASLGDPNSVKLNETTGHTAPNWSTVNLPKTLFYYQPNGEPSWWSQGTCPFDPAAFVLDDPNNPCQLPAQSKWGD